MSTHSQLYCINSKTSTFTPFFITTIFLVSLIYFVMNFSTMVDYERIGYGFLSLSWGVLTALILFFRNELTIQIDSKNRCFHLIKTPFLRPMQTKTIPFSAVKSVKLHAHYRGSTSEYFSISLEMKNGQSIEIHAPTDFKTAQNVAEKIRHAVKIS